jgi:hypothetical protein
MFGKLLTEIQAQRKFTRERAMADLWRRNKLSPGAPGYRLAEAPTVQADGSEITEYRLYRLVDATVTTISSQVKAETDNGVQAIHERLR